MINCHDKIRHETYQSCHKVWSETYHLILQRLRKEVHWWKEYLHFRNEPLTYSTLSATRLVENFGLLLLRIIVDYNYSKQMVTNIDCFIKNVSLTIWSLFVARFIYAIIFTLKHYHNYIPEIKLLIWTIDTLRT